MTYCVAITVNTGIIFCSDSRTSAGIDHVRAYSKTHSYSLQGDRQITILSSGNLATTQAVLAQVDKDIDHSAKTNLYNVTSLRNAANYIGELSIKEQNKHGSDTDESNYESTFILGGQIGTNAHEILLIYPQGNCISTSQDTPYLQIGESKYGKPILDRVLTPSTTLSTATSAALVSMDSTMRSNLSVGPPIEISIYKANSLQAPLYTKFEEGSEYLRELKNCWDQRIKEAFKQLPPIEWANLWDQALDEQNSIS